MKLESIDSLEEIISKYNFDQIFCSEQFLRQIAMKLDYYINSEIFIDGFSGDNYSYIKVNNKRIDIYPIDPTWYRGSMATDAIILKHSNLAKERKTKLNTIHNSIN